MKHLYQNLFTSAWKILLYFFIFSIILMIMIEAHRDLVAIASHWRWSMRSIFQFHFCQFYLSSRKTSFRFNHCQSHNVIIIRRGWATSKSPHFHFHQKIIVLIVLIVLISIRWRWKNLTSKSANRVRRLSQSPIHRLEEEKFEFEVLIMSNRDI